MSEHDELVEDQEAAPETGQVAKIDLNTASVDELRQLPGIGPTLAARIVNYREEVHSFEEPVEIAAVQGISESMYDNIADRLVVSPAVTLKLEAEPEVEHEDEEPQVPEVEEPEEIPVEEPEVVPVEEPEELLVEEPEPVEVEKEPLPRIEPPPPPPPPAPAPRVGWGRFLLVGLASALAGACLALLLLLSINGTLDYLREDGLGPIRTQAGELENRIEVINTDLALRLDGAQADIQRLRDDLSTTWVEIDTMAGTLDAMRPEMTNLREDLDAMAGQVGALRQRVDALDEQLAILNQDIDDMRDTLLRFDAFLGGLRHLLNETMGPPTPTPWATRTPTVVPTPTP